MLPSVTPKLAQCKSTFDMHSFRLHHNCKIDTARFEQGKRPPTSSRLAPRTKLSRVAWTRAPCWIKRERGSHVVGRRIRRWKSSHSLARLTAWWISQSQQQGARFWTGTHAERRGRGATDCSRNVGFGMSASEDQRTWFVEQVTSAFTPIGQQGNSVTLSDRAAHG